MSSTANPAGDIAQLPAAPHHATGVRLISRLLLRPQQPRPAPQAEAADQTAARVAPLDPELEVCLDLEAAMMAIIVAGAALFAAGLLGYGPAETPWTADGVRALQSLATGAAAFAIWSVLSGLVGFARLVRPSR